MACFQILDGPDKSTLQAALFHRCCDRPFPAFFTLQAEDKTMYRWNMHVAAVSIEDGSGHSWIITLQSPDFRTYYSGTYRTDNRKGQIEDVEAEAQSQACVQDRLETAMAWGWNVLIIFKNNSDSPFCGQRAVFSNPRVSPRRPLTRVCLTPAADDCASEARHAAENVGLMIAHMKSVQVFRPL